MKLRNVYLALKGQLPLARFYRNFFVTGNAWGMFSRNSHISRGSKKPKVEYGSLASAEKAAAAMERKHGGVFRSYKCVYCDGYHIGKNAA
ncbi:hypothetical protein HOU00_gp199 [Caulobacter phage CcrPW]|uniref:Uncharacterized protein n=1 Tax=Caulobacter phage CcrPW TaxID=2283271 RepID=A0A385EB26_9CAUD|nr:hypothetical protein HOU00_gp199 [Caulobacter phage CcrPW]AXQ68926.1 hypothetical protein CcrPW_gp387c [Caulobacter phage CcrPW]